MKEKKENPVVTRLTDSPGLGGAPLRWQESVTTSTTNSFGFLKTMTIMDGLANCLKEKEGEQSSPKRLIHLTFSVIPRFFVLECEFLCDLVKASAPSPTNRMTSFTPRPNWIVGRPLLPLASGVEEMVFMIAAAVESESA